MKKAGQIGPGKKMLYQKEPGETGGAGCREDRAGELSKLAREIPPR